jgi:cytidine deaminase
MSLLHAAQNARKNAHAPYSRFSVGAAIRTESGAIFVGCNVENAASPEGTCAETGAIAAMVAAGERVIAEVCVVADSPEPVPPCGGCRQRMAEFARGKVPVTMVTTTGQSRTMTLEELLPGAFSAAHRRLA